MNYSANHLNYIFFSDYIQPKRMTLIDEFVSSKAERLVLIRDHFGLKAKQFADALEENPSNYYQIEAGARKIGKLKSNELIQKINSLPHPVRKGQMISRDWWETGEGEMIVLLSHDESVRADQDGHHNKQNVQYKGGGDQEDARQKLREAELKIQALERENELLKEINALLKNGK